MRLEPLAAPFGAVVEDVDLRRLDEATWHGLREAWLEYALLVFPDQFLRPAEQDEFALRFGELEFTAAPLTNIRRDGSTRSDPDDDLVKSLRGNEGWHHDSTYMPLQAKGAVFSADIVPPSGGGTEWADMRAAYDALDDATSTRIADLAAHHSIHYSMQRAGYLPTNRNDDGSYKQYGYHDLEPPLRPLVKVHPETGRANLLIGRHAYGIPGLTEDDSVALLDHLNEWACQAPRTYHHLWTTGEVCVWDNRRLMHRGRPFDMTEPRRMWHTRIAGDAPSELALNHRAVGE